MSIFLLVFSFLLQGILSLYLPFHFNQLYFLSYHFLVVVLVILYPIYYKKKKITMYYIICILYGLLFDFVYTNTLMIDSILFLVIGIVARFFYLKLDDNLFNLFFILLSSIFLYDTLFYLLMVLFANIPFHPFDLFYKFIHSILLNLIYGFIIYAFITKYKKKIKTSIYV